MTRTLVSVLFGWLVLFCANALAQTLPIGVVEVDRVIAETRVGKQARQEIDEFVKARQKVIDEDQAKLIKLQEELAKQAANLNDAERRARETAVDQADADYRRKVAKMEQEVHTKSDEVMAGLIKKIEAATKAVAERAKLTLVLNKGDSGNPPFVLYGHPKMDLTPAVMADLDKK